MSSGSFASSHCSDHCALSGHTKAVTAIALDDAGARLLTGGHDYMVKIFDFGGMKSDAKPFRSFEVDEGHPIVSVSAAGRLFQGQLHCFTPTGN